MTFSPQQSQYQQTTFAGDEATAFYIVYIGTGVGTVDYGGVNTGIFTDTESGATLPDDDTTTVGTLDVDVATVATVGLMRDVINASSGFRCFLVGSVEGDDWDDEILDTTVTTINPGETIDVKWDSEDHVLGTGLVRQCLGPESDETRRGAARRSTQNSGRREVDSSSNVEILDREFVPLMRARVKRVTFKAGDDGTTETITGQLTIRSADQLGSETVIYSGPVESDTADAVALSLQVQVDFDPPLFSIFGERMIFDFTPTPSTGDAIDAVELTVEGEYGIAGS